MRTPVCATIVFMLLSLVSGGFSQSMEITLKSPSRNARFVSCGDIPFAADVVIHSGTVKRVDFYANGARVKGVTTAPYEATWQGVADGIYEISATVVDVDGAEFRTDSYFIFVGAVEAGNMIINGEFNCELLPWRLDNYVNAQSTITVVPDLWLTDDSSGVLIEITAQGDEFWAVQLMQPFKIKAGHTYDVTFAAQADEPKLIYVDISKNYDDYSQVHSATFTIDEPEIYGPFAFTAAADDDNLMFKFVLGGNTIPIEIDAVNVIDRQWTVARSKQEFPASPRLRQNFPNPFNPGTTIEYYIDEPTDVEITIYNIEGHAIVSSHVHRDVGWHSFTWNGSTDDGTTCASGVYIYRFSAGKVRLAKKMHLLR
ncbi:carbohydrate binding domain-containing protein [candidate division KSB1 bacterium]|nr:carbohydrate binding domain-containing protein [candidate division KSB1 bacterium]